MSDGINSFAIVACHFNNIITRLHWFTIIGHSKSYLAMLQYFNLHDMFAKYFAINNLI